MSKEKEALVRAVGRMVAVIKAAKEAIPEKAEEEEAIEETETE